MNKLISTFLLFFSFLGSVFASSPFEYALYDSLALNGAWEMAYLKSAPEGDACPTFKGVQIADAVPGYWEDMIPEFRKAGMKDEFLPNPHFKKQTFPFTKRADDTTIPQIYGCFLYRKNIVSDRDGAAVLWFQGVRNSVKAWVNGRFIGYHDGFSTSFELSVPEKVLRKGPNEIVLLVSNAPVKGELFPEVIGLTTRALFASTGGVNGKMELRFPASDIADVYVTTAQDLKSFTVHVSGNDFYSWQILDRKRVAAKGNGQGDFTLPTDGFEFWTPEYPKRYELKISCKGKTYSQKFGLRRLTVDGEKLRLNGKLVYLRGITEHCYYANTIHVPRDLEYYREITVKRKELGFNFLRFHTQVPPEEYLEAMDELGMLVHVESPNFVTLAEWRQIIAMSRKHPSVVIYCTGNETSITIPVEGYLKTVADMVHTQTDSLFSPMSALRGAEYAFRSPEDDPLVSTPFRHNPSRFKRLSAYCDLFTSYQLGTVSYNSLNYGTAKTLDAWGDVYCGKPRLSHEICIDGSYVDFTTEKLYPKDSPILKIGMFSGIREMMKSKGVFDRAETYYRNSCEWMMRIRKHCFEKLRLSDRVAGYDFLGDINTHWHTFGYSVGMMDEFFRLKPGESVENVLRYNSAAVLLSNLGSDFNIYAGVTTNITISVSNYDRPASGANLEVSLVSAKDGKTVWTEKKSFASIAHGEITNLGTFAVAAPDSAKATKYILKTSLVDKDGAIASNEWELYAFPKVEKKDIPSNIKIVEKFSKEDLLASMKKGERVLLLGWRPFKVLATSYRIGLAGRPAGNYATVIKNGHPALESFPHEGFCGWQFRRLMHKAAAVQLEADVPFDPIIDIASSVKNVIRQSPMFEYRIGDGRLFVCSFAFNESDPAAAYLKSLLIDYVASDKFNPPAIGEEQLAALCNKPAVKASENDNKALNLNDPAARAKQRK